MVGVQMGANKITANQEILKILLVDDHPLVKVGLVTELKKEKNFCVVATASTGLEAIEKACEYDPDVILLDISLPDMSGIEVIERILSKNPKARIIALTMHKNISYVKVMKELGARGYILKDSSPELLTQAILASMKNAKFFFPYTFTTATKNNKEELTKREKEILNLITSGLSNKMIADKLHISKRTVESHRERIKKKLNINNTADLTKYALTLDIPVGTVKF